MNSVHHEEKPHGKVRTVIGLIVILIVFAGFIYAGYSLTALLYRATGRPPEGPAHVFSALAGILLLCICALVFNSIRKHRGAGLRRHFIGSVMMDALDQIAHGNFNVLINMDDIGPQHHEIAEAINDMARNLGTLEISLGAIPRGFESRPLRHLPKAWNHRVSSL